jgi:cell division protein FtsN
VWGDALGWRVFYRVVVVAPLETAQQATQLCNNLKAQGVACVIRAT